MRKKRVWNTSVNHLKQKKQTMDSISWNTLGFVIASLFAISNVIVQASEYENHTASEKTSDNELNWIGALEWGQQIVDCISQATENIYLLSSDYPDRCCKIPALSEPCALARRRSMAEGGGSKPKWLRQSRQRKLYPVSKLMAHVSCIKTMLHKSDSRSLPEVCCHLRYFRSKCKQGLHADQKL